MSDHHRHKDRILVTIVVPPGQQIIDCKIISSAKTDKMMDRSADCRGCCERACYSVLVGLVIGRSDSPATRLNKHLPAYCLRVRVCHTRCISVVRHCNPEPPEPPSTRHILTCTHYWHCTHSLQPLPPAFSIITFLLCRSSCLIAVSGLIASLSRPSAEQIGLSVGLFNPSSSSVCICKTKLSHGGARSLHSESPRCSPVAYLTTCRQTLQDQLPS